MSSENENDNEYGEQQEERQEAEEEEEQQEETSSSLMKESKTSEYDRYLNELKTFHHSTAKEAIKRMFDLLKIDDPFMSLQDIHDRILKDLIEIWARGTILNNMPDELKQAERQESGRRGKQKQQVSSLVGASGEVIINPPEPSRIEPGYTTKSEDEEKQQIAHDSWAKSLSEGIKLGYQPDTDDDAILAKSEDDDKPEEIDEWTIVSKRDPKARGPTVGIDADHLKRLESAKEGLEIENDFLKEQLDEQRKQLEELIQSVNSASKIKPTSSSLSATSTKDSLEYKALLSELHLVKQDRDKLKQVASMQMEAHPTDTFRPASLCDDDGPIEALHQVVNKDKAFEVEIPANKLIHFFKDARDARDVMYIQIKDGKVIGWESDYTRNKK